MKILHADDHPMLLVAVKYLLEKLDSAVHVISTASFSETQNALSLHNDLELLLLDLEMPGTKGMSGFHTLRQQWPELRIAILSGSEEPERIHEALDNGAVGFIPKSHSGELMLNAFKLILAGGVYVPGPLPPRASTDYELSERQQQVLALIATGASNKDIAGELYISEGTVKVHVNTIFKTLKVKNRTQAILKAREGGLLI
ncbi:MAG: response regulator transcription factor [Pseudomonadota bacterium]